MEKRNQPNTTSFFPINLGVIRGRKEASGKKFLLFPRVLDRRANNEERESARGSHPTRKPGETSALSNVFSTRTSDAMRAHARLLPSPALSPPRDLFCLVVARKRKNNPLFFSIASHLDLVAADGSLGDGLAGGDAGRLLAEAGAGDSLSRDVGSEHLSRHLCLGRGGGAGSS